MTLKKVISLLIIGVLVLFISNCGKQENTESKEENIQIVSIDNADFVGDQACISCHTEQHQDWHNSHHDWAMKKPNDSTVLADFNAKELKLDGVQYRFNKEDGKFKVSVKESNAEEKTYSIAYTFGFFPLQQYLVEGENGEYNTLRITWNSEDKVWYHQYKDQKIAPDDWLHWTKGGQRWNTMCAECHSTDLKKNYNIENQTFNTTYKTINIGCESCHGQGSQHLEWAKKGTGDDKHIFKPTDQTSTLNQCAPCHSRRAKITESSNPWEAFSQNYLIQNISPAFYELDGQIKEEDYVFGSFLSSKMYHEGVKCTDCHNPHSLKLLAEGNNLCMSCHEPKYNTKEHTNHQLNTEASECVSCHMPGKKYMGHDFRRDHSFRVPRPDQSVEFGTPNACNGCHQDKSAKWASENIIKWYGANRKAHFSDYLLTSTNATLTETEEKEVLDFISNTSFPEIARSTMVENLEFKIELDVFAELLQKIDNSSPLVLNSMLSIFIQQAPETRLFLARQHLFHPEKIVRITATKLLLDIPLAQFTEIERKQLIKTELELKEMLNASADFPAGRIQLADYYFRKKQLKEAKKHYEVALEMDYLLLSVYTNLATVYNMLGENDNALTILAKAIKLDPKNGQYDYLKGLLEYEMGKPKEAELSLLHSIKKERTLVKAYYNLSIIYFENKEIQKAENILEKGLLVAPNSQEMKDFLKMIRDNKI